RISATIRTARSRSSGGYLLDEPPDMTPSFPRTGVSGHAGAVHVPDFFRIPYDPHLATGLAVDFSSLKRRTRNAVLDLAGGLAQHYPASRVRPRGEDSWKTWIETMRQVG
ncbi:hypothetical protein ACNJGK_20295, partial [Mycobacterium tuberculosis]